jgi:predicted amidophosphoribosyltransferase
MLYQYEGLIRSLVIRAKVTNDAVAAGFVVRYIMTAWQRDQKDEDLRLVIPAPPSFWGRIRGRIDLAELVAWSFGSLGHPVLSVIPGGPLRSKRAGRNTLIDRKFLKTDFFNKNIFYFNEKRRSQALISRYKQILVVDDVLTTGLTMGSVFNQLEELGAQSVAGLVFASSS